MDAETFHDQTKARLQYTNPELVRSLGDLECCAEGEFFAVSYPETFTSSANDSQGGGE